MASKRMFALCVVDSDLFLDMPLSTQALYFHLGMRADDSGFVPNIKKIRNMINATDDDVKLLIAKGYLISFDNGLFVIRHWKQNNTIRKDRHKTTIFQKELRMLTEDENQAYILSSINEEAKLLNYSSDSHCQPVVNQVATKCQPSVNQVSTSCQPSGNQVSTSCQPSGNQESTSCQPRVNQVATKSQPSGNQESTKWQPRVNQLSTKCQPSGNQESTSCQPSVNQLSTKSQPVVAVDKTRLDLDKIRLELLQYGNKFKQESSRSFILEDFLEEWITEKSKEKDNPTAYAASLKNKYQNGQESVLDEFSRWVQTKIDNLQEKEKRNKTVELIGKKVITAQGEKEILDVTTTNKGYKIVFTDHNFAEVTDIEEFIKILEKQEKLK